MFERLYFHEVTLQYSSKKCNHQLVRKKIFQTKEDFISCSKLKINELWHCPNRSDNVYFTSNEQSSIGFTAAYYTCRT